MEVREVGTLVEIFCGPLDWNGRCSSATGHKKGDTALREAFAIVNVSGTDHDSGVYPGRHDFKVVPQRDLVRSRIVTDVNPGLDIRHGRMVKTDQNKFDAPRHVLQLVIEPPLLIASHQ